MTDINILALERLLKSLRKYGVRRANLEGFGEVEFAPAPSEGPATAGPEDREAWRKHMEEGDGEAAQVHLTGPLAAPGLYSGGVPLIPNYESEERSEDE